jgi:hypothetical protein
VTPCLFALPFFLLLLPLVLVLALTLGVGPVLLLLVCKLLAGAAAPQLLGPGLPAATDVLQLV